MAERLTWRMPMALRVACFALSLPATLCAPAFGWLAADTAGLPSPAEKVLDPKATEAALRSGKVASLTWKEPSGGFPGYVRLLDGSQEPTYADATRPRATADLARGLGVDVREVDVTESREVLAVLGFAFAAVLARMSALHFLTRGGIPWSAPEATDREPLP